SLEYRFQVPGVDSAYFRGNYQYVGSYARTLPPGVAGYDAFTYSANSYSYGAARVGVLRGNWEAALFVNNIANARPIIAKDDSLSPGTQTAETTLHPRSFGLFVQRRF